MLHTNVSRQIDIFLLPLLCVLSVAQGFHVSLQATRLSHHVKRNFSKFCQGSKLVARPLAVLIDGMILGPSCLRLFTALE